VIAIETRVAAPPVPVSETVCGELPALSPKLNVADLLPVVSGENVTDAVQLTPAANGFGLSGQVVE
jgi:hypothetical protein